jgi:hypothetical protein
MRPVAVGAVKLEDNFWQPRRAINRRVTILTQYEQCEQTGRMDNFRKAAGKKEGDFEGLFFNDSDIYKFLEAAAWHLADGPDAELDQLIDSITAEIAAAQQSDGYLDTYFMGERVKERWTNFDFHEMYCAGHLFQAAVAHYRCTGKTNLLDIATHLADHISNRFGPEDQGKVFGVDGHPEVEMALAELYRLTGDKKYLDQVEYFVDVRGYGRINQRPFGRQEIAYHQDHLPFRQLTRLEGHSVRALYLNSGAADLYAETGDAALLTAMGRMWASLTGRQMYVTGGIGSRRESEGFGPDYELPNDTAYTETCATIANLMWNWRLLLVEPHARYADLMELALYNGILSGLSLDGKGYFYENPLSNDGSHRRQPWFVCACCPPNVARLIAQLPGHLYTTSEGAIWAHLYASNTAKLDIPNGPSVELIQRADYPWSGDVTLQTQTAGNYTLNLRLPGWCAEGWSVTLNGGTVNYTVTPGRYIQIKRGWAAGDTIKLALPMTIQQFVSHPNVVDNQGRVALKRGPLIYCLEAADNPGFEVRHLALAEDAALTAEFRPDLLNGVTILRGQGQIITPAEAWGEELYRPRGRRGAGQSLAFTAIPYYAWANREPGAMQVWLHGV